MIEFSQEDEKMSMSLGGLIKFNNGLFKSERQAKFILSMTGSITPENYHIPAEECSKVIVITGTIRWADYGRKSIVPITYVFCFDECGITKKYKLGSTDGMFDSAKVVVTWERPVNIELLVYSTQPTEAPVNPSMHLGQSGVRQKFTGKLISCRAFQKPQFSYYDSTIGFVSTVIVDGKDIVLYWNQFKDVEVGDVFTFAATVKEHNKTQRGENQTVISRAKVVSIVKEEVSA